MKHRRSRGFALALVLIMIVLAVTIATVFLASTGRERRSVDLYSRESQVRNLSDMAVNRVTGEINAATKEGTLVAPVSWASQPGMIRTYDAAGAARNVYKLYSWDTLVEAGTGFQPGAANEIPDPGWKASRALYTDLNAPSNGVYPIVDPAASGVVQGFSIDTTDPIITGSGLSAPMPVKWLYVLEDGQNVAGTASTPNTVTVAGASATNPIVGRIAFWTDDETAKVNVNTASEGEFWDWPKGGSLDEMQFAGNPPVHGEYQRVPGHPAMTSLSAVFPEMVTASSRWTGTGVGAGINSTYTTEQSQVFPVTPRYEWGGSQGGTVPIGTYGFGYGPALTQTNAPALPSVKSDRLYAEPQELLFGSKTDSANPPARVRNTYTGTNTTVITPDQLRQREFFLTAASRAPETNLFGLPRVSLWPVTWPYPSSYFNIRGGAPTAADPTTDTNLNPWMTPQERLLAFCATLNKQATKENRYYIQRQNPDSPTYDWTKITRNQQIFGNYLYTLTGKAVPGYGGVLNEPESTLTKIFDYSRSCINQYTPDPYPTAAPPAGNPQSALKYSYTGYTGNSGSTTSAEPQAFSVVPISATVGGATRQGLGSFPKVKEAALVFYATKRNPAQFTGGTTADRRDPRLWKNLIDMTQGISQTTEMRAVLLFDFINGMTANVGQSPTFWINVVQGEFNINGVDVNLKGRKVQWSSYIGNNAPTYAGLYTRKKTRATNQATPAAKTFDPTTGGEDVWSLISPAVPVATSTFTFNTVQPLKLEFYGVGSDPATDTTTDPTMLISKCTIDFTPWNSTYPTPLAPAFSDWDCPPTASGDSPWAVADGAKIPDPMFNDGTSPAGTYRWIGTEIAPQLLPDPTSVATFGSPNSSAEALGTHRGDRPTPYLPGFSTDFQQRVQYGESSAGGSLSYTSLVGTTCAPFNGTNSYLDTGVTLITPYDTAISMVLDPSSGGGDPRVVEQQAYVRADTLFPSTNPREAIFRSIQGANGGTAKDAHRFIQAPRNNWQYHTLGNNVEPHFASGFNFNQTVVGAPMATAVVSMSGASIPGNLGNRRDWSSSVRPLSLAVSPAGGLADWSSGGGAEPDGGAVVRADQDYQIFFQKGSYKYMQTPYYPDNGLGVSPTATVTSTGKLVTAFSPNRQVPSPVVLGCLPRGTTKGWQTLAFSPNPANPNHPGLASASNKAPDHLWLDLFWMPVAEPYPMSDQFTTAGKVNLNYRIAPFAYIKRQTGLYAAMKSTWLTAMPASIAADFKSPYWMKQNNPSTRTRYQIDVAETLKGFDAKFQGGNLFRSASQLCEMSLVPQGQTLAGISGFWANNTLTSDTAREEPYDHLYSRVTTTSNTFTVHWRVQALRKVPGTPATGWDEIRDKVTADKRGSTLIERYLDPNATTIPDYADPAVLSGATPLSNFYKWRTVSERFFQPSY